MALLVVAQVAAEQVGQERPEQEPLGVQPAEVRLEQEPLEQELREHPAGQSFPARIAVAAVADHRLPIERKAEA